MMEYKGYVGRSEINEETGLIFGDVIGLRDVITYQGWSVDEARKAFKDSIDLYLQTCAEEGLEPDKPYSGKLLIRTKPSTHRALVARAKVSGKSLNFVVDRILTKAVRKREVPISPIEVKVKPNDVKTTAREFQKTMKARAAAQAAAQPPKVVRKKKAR